MAFKVALPIAVPREVVNLSTARNRSSLSWVGGTTIWAKPAKATMPMRVPSTCSSINERAACWATANRLAMQPLNQMPERADREASLGLEPVFGNALSDLIGDPAWQALMPFRLGYAQREALPSPRRAVEDVLVMRG